MSLLAEKTRSEFVEEFLQQEEVSTPVNSVDIMSEHLGEPIFGSVSKIIVSNGWSIYPQTRDSDGRRPAKCDGQMIKWGGLVKALPSKEDINEWNLWCAQENVALVFGAASNNTFCLDIDITEEVLSREVRAIVEEVLGETNLVRQGQAPKLAMIYKMAEGTTITSRKIIFKEGHAVEVLASGSSLTIHGRHHKTGDYFKWLTGNSPQTVKSKDVVEITTEQFDKFVNRLETKFQIEKSVSSRLEDGKIEWVESGDCVVPDLSNIPGVTRGRDNLIVDGRLHYLKALVRETIRGNPDKFAEALVDQAGMDDYRNKIGMAILAEFTSKCELTSEWRYKAKGNIRGLLNFYIELARNGTLKLSKKANVRSATAATSIDEDFPCIELKNARLAENVETLESFLVDKKKLYQTPAGLFDIDDKVTSIADGKHITVKRFIRYNDRSLQLTLSGSADFIQKNSKGKLCAINPDIELARSILAKKTTKAPFLKGMVNMPLMRKDGSIFNEPGYDSKSGFFLDINKGEFPEVLESPTYEDAKASMNNLLKLISSFPFVSELDKAIHISALITGVTRKMYRHAPMFVYRANAPGSGKTTLADQPSIVATGNEAEVVPYGEEVEIKKALTGTIMGGAGAINFDNVNGEFGNAIIQKLISRGTHTDRILGTQKNVDLESEILLLATGNDIAPTLDIVRRVLECVIDRKMANPENFKYSEDIYAVTKSRRKDIVKDIHTIIRAYIQAGKPKNDKSIPFNGFNDWCDIVRDSIVWLGLPDVVQATVRTKERDPKHVALTAALYQWVSVMGYDSFTLNEVMQKASAYDERTGKWINSEFKQVLLEIAGNDGKLISTNKLGKFLSNNSSIIDNLRFTRGKLKDGVRTWQVENILE